MHCKLLMGLEERIIQWDDTKCIGDVFITNAERLKMYTTYVNNYDTALKTLAYCGNKKPFAKFMKVYISPKCKSETMILTNNPLQEIEKQDIRLDLPAHLIQPVQRIPRYCLLLQVIS